MDTETNRQRPELGNWYADYQRSATTLNQSRESIYTMLTVPAKLEPLVGLGIFTAIDAMLWFAVIFPMRSLLAIFNVCVFNKLRKSTVLDLCRTFILVVSLVALFKFMNISYLYHVLKAQSILKIYAFYNILDLLDRCLGSFGLDISAALTLSVFNFVNIFEKKSSPPSDTRPRSRSFISNFNYVPTSRAKALQGLLCDLVLACIYSIIHSSLMILEVVTLSVAVNAHGNMLFSMVISHSFSELKTWVLKRTDSSSLYQIILADIFKRTFRLISLVLILCSSLNNFGCVDLDGKNSFSMCQRIIFHVILVYVSEILVDNWKYCFIFKFNAMSLDLVPSFKATLLSDISSSIAPQMNKDPSLLLSRKIGISPLATTAFFIYMLRGELRYKLDLLCIIMACLLLLKLVLSTFLTKLGSKSQEFIDKNLDENQKKLVVKLQGIERFSMIGKKLP